MAGEGYLDQDWLANTLDPTPLFSGLVYLTFHFFTHTAIFYIYYALLMGIYIYSLLGITSSLFALRRSPLQTLLYLALLITLHSAALRFTLSQSLGTNWGYVLEDGVADQRLLGPVFQPSSFGVLLVLSIYLFLRQRPYLAVLVAALAATFHPTYLLSAASLTLSYMLVTFQEDRRLVKPILLGLVALLAVSPILYYVYANFGSTPAETSAKAQDILVRFRIPHHAVIRQWFDLTVVVKLLLVAAGLYITRKNRLFLILLVPLCISTGLTLVQLISGSNALALLFPWRNTTYLVPLSSALILAWIVFSLTDRYATWFVRRQTAVVVASLALISAVVIIGILRIRLDFSRQPAADDRPAMAFAAGEAASGQVYLTPIDMQDFRLFTGLPVYVDFKSIPYRDADVLEWRRRLRLADRFYDRGSCEIIEYVIAEGVTHAIMSPEAPGADCPQLHQVYKDDNYAVYRLE